jgi:hypothetical protein
MLMAAPALAQEIEVSPVTSSEMTPLGTVAPGQSSFTLDAQGHLVDRQAVIDQQLATDPGPSAPRTGPYDDESFGGAEHPEANGRNASPILSSQIGNGG